MINKQSLWFLTLFSLILVLSVYYITMPSDLFLTTNGKQEETKTTSKEEEETKVSIEESELLVAMRVSLEEERQEEMKELRSALTSGEATSEDKNNAYEQIKYLTDLKGKEEAMEEKINKSFSLDSFVKIDNNEVKVVAIKKEHDASLANQIMRLVQEEFKEKMYITVKFEK